MDSISTKTDESLMKEFIAGQDIAFEELAIRYEKPILNFAYFYLKNIPLSEDITQDVFVRIVESKSSYNPQKLFKAWIYQIARNRIYDELRRKKRWTLRIFQPKEQNDMSQEIGAFPDPALSPRETLNQQHIQQILIQEIHHLDEKSRDMIILRFIQGLSVRETSDTLNIPEGTIHSGIHRALQKLHKSISQKGISLEDLI